MQLIISLLSLIASFALANNVGTSSIQQNKAAGTPISNVASTAARQAQEAILDTKKEDGFRTIKLFDTTDAKKVKNSFKAIQDCDDGKCLLDSEEFEDEKVYAGLTFDENFPTKYTAATEKFNSFLSITNVSKRAYDGIHILAEEHNVEDSQHPLFTYIKDTSLPKNSLITLHYTPDSEVFNRLVKKAVRKFHRVFVHLKWKQIPIKTLKEFKNVIFISNFFQYVQNILEDSVEIFHVDSEPKAPGKFFSSDIDTCEYSS
ncbi:hypothetical protein DSO57_1003510 [Entomophthora muscae]|uniref:Uncharacterized protein n=1 Tax=Entomophthora muscae TaxID=34485 RepID=A0ACC2RNB1_9FUNG|nr:hypothetical protein DSO57_1003510 [Entomophthora muscae]